MSDSKYVPTLAQAQRAARSAKRAGRLVPELYARVIRSHRRAEAEKAPRASARRAAAGRANARRGWSSRGAHPGSGLSRFRKEGS